MKPATKICAGCRKPKPREAFANKELVCFACGGKRCIECGELKSADEFYRMRKGGEALQARCKACDNQARAYGSLREERSRRPTKGKACHICEGMPWARYHRETEPEPPLVGTPCPGCGEPYAPEQERTIDDFLDARKDGGLDVYAEGGW